ncbi:SDR family oxidoreductase [Lutibacter sp. B1]|uniref:SDR family oxidoreductase n=1 Tax=Lutibacter sp. B1 TaxID=2725996 RepID=UPI0014570F70|nr:SDR family oxidoreductase [Lutibacter sp. B1]NLP57214.1 SDR family oxidoreductase [Lutibacter sp. B1]
MSVLKGKRVLITGGASGIGKIMGRLVLERGAELIIWDINTIKIEEVQNEFSELGKTHGYTVDVSNPEQVKNSAAIVKSDIGIVDILINNAGIVVGKYFHEHSLQDITKTMDINSNAPMIITQQFLPDMLNQNSGYICNIASSAGLISNPKMSVYAASKWAVIGWSDSLRLEMKQLKKNIGVTTVTPYYINTGMFDGVKSIIPILNPEKVAKKIIRAIERNRIFLSMPWSVHFVRFSQGILPIWFFDWFVGRVMGIYKTMEHFTGRK